MAPADRPETDDLVVRAALGEPLSAQEQALLEADADLQAEVAAFREVADLARSAPDEVAATPAIDHLWEGIAAEAFDDRDTGSNVVPLRPGTSRWLGLAAVAAAAAAVVTLVTVGPWASRDAATPLAAADLQPFGDAEVDPVAGEFVATDGTAELHLDLSGLPAPDGAFYEVWLLDPDQGRLVSLGPVRPDGTYVLPAGAAPGEWPAVDVSIEPHDGDPGHSGASVLRGPVQSQA